MPTTIHSDFFWIYEKDENGNDINIRPNPAGAIKIDGVTPTRPLYNPEHKYSFTVVGTGAPFSIVFYDGDYSDNDDGPGMANISGEDADV